MDKRRSESTPTPDQVNIFKEVNLQTAPWLLMEPNNGAGRSVYEVTIRVGRFIINGTLVRNEGHGSFIDHYDFELCDSNRDRIIGGTAIFFQPTDGSVGTIEAGIERYDRYRDSKSPLPPGSGIAFYKKILDLMQSVSNDDGSSYVHTVKARPKGMSAENWDAHFAPVLEERGYTELKWGRWEKLYTPQY